MVVVQDQLPGLRGLSRVRSIPRRLAGLVVLLVPAAPALAADWPKDLWVARPVIRPEVPAGRTDSPNPIDAFLADQRAVAGLKPVGPADRATLLRRVTLDLTGLPPTPEEQSGFLADEAPGAYERVVDRLLASEQHGVRYGRHWLDVLRYADVDERMLAAPGIHHWRDWVTRALNDDLPYDQFVRAQLTGSRAATRTQMSPTGVRSRVEPRLDDQFALGFLARGAVFRDGKDARELPIAAVETVSTAFMGLTVGCAKCHDHMYDPISQRDFYAMKALFDPLVVRKVTLATAAEVVAAGRAADEADRLRAAAEAPVEAILAPHRARLREERIFMLPPDAQAVIRKPERSRTAAEQKVADDYFPILRIDTGVVVAVLPDDEKRRYKELQARVPQGNRGPTLPAFWTVEVDPKKELEPSYVLTSGEVDRPERDKEVKPGWPFMPPDVDFREGRVEAFADWLTTPENPMFARVAVNRLWQWHFGTGLHKNVSDFGRQAGKPTDPPLLDWLASEFVARGFRMKEIHRLIVTSDAYRLASEVDQAGSMAELAADPGDDRLWHFRLRRLEAEPIWDAIFSAAGDLDTALGGPSFEPGGGRRAKANGPIRRAAYMIRGFSTNRDVVPDYLQAFDVEDGRAPCPIRTRTVTAPQALFLMNSEVVAGASERFADRLRRESGGDLPRAVDLGYGIAVARSPSAHEREVALAYLQGDPARLPGFAWLLFNLDEFVYAR